MLEVKDRKFVLSLAVPLIIGALVLLTLGVILTNLMVELHASMLFDGTLISLFFVVSLTILWGIFFTWRKALRRAE